MSDIYLACNWYKFFFSLFFSFPPHPQLTFYTHIHNNISDCLGERRRKDPAHVWKMIKTHFKLNQSMWKLLQPIDWIIKAPNKTKSLFSINAMSSKLKICREWKKFQFTFKSLTFALCFEFILIEHHFIASFWLL